MPGVQGSKQQYYPRNQAAAIRVKHLQLDGVDPGRRSTQKHDEVTTLILGTDRHTL